MSKHKKLVQEAIRIAGSQGKLAKRLGISQQGVSYLLNSAKRVPAEIAVAIDSFTGGEISKEKLRPDLFRGAQ